MHSKNRKYFPDERGEGEGEKEQQQQRIRGCAAIIAQAARPDSGRRGGERIDHKNDRGEPVGLSIPGRDPRNPSDNILSLRLYSRVVLEQGEEHLKNEKGLG